jgi:DNA-binding NarL/FixJ family response regulator
MVKRAMEQPTITTRQRQVIELIAAGLTSEKIADTLGIAPRTVKAHCDTLRLKLGVSQRRGLPYAYRKLTGNDPFPATLRSPADDTEG